MRSCKQICRTMVSRECSANTRGGLKKAIERKSEKVSLKELAISLVCSLYMTVGYVCAFQGELFDFLSLKKVLEGM